MTSRAVAVLFATLAFGCASNLSHGRGEDAGLDGGGGDAGGPTDAGDRPGDAGTRSCAEGCAPLERCVDDTCQDYPPCAGDGTCPMGEICQQRRCLPADRDLDGDGVVAMDDCDESDPAVYPGAPEECNGRDDDCDDDTDEMIAARMCSSACGGGNEICSEGAWTGCTAVMPVPETCNGMDDDCDSQTDEELVRACSTACGNGTETCVRGGWSTCTAPAPQPETCNNIDDDCNRMIDDGLTRACSTACGAGNEVCTVGSWGMCDAPPVVSEACNLVDDDCNGACDDLGGCRRAVHRSFNTASGEHFYTTSSSEAACCGFAVEFLNYYYLYRAANPNVVPFYRCRLSNGFHFYTRSATCEGSAGSVVEGTMGYLSATARCGSTPLYRLVRGADHFYTVSASERTSAMGLGYASEGVAGHVWLAP